MPVSHHSRLDCFLVQDFRLTEGDSEAEPLLHQLLQHLQLNHTHNADVDFLQVLLPNHIQRRLLRLQYAEYTKHLLHMKGIAEFHLGLQSRLRIVNQRIR
ncbi:hypothetical protein D3C76_1597070 [compost metagenome]